jgi:hypothetical protein
VVKIAILSNPESGPRAPDGEAAARGYDVGADSGSMISVVTDVDPVL